MQSNVVFMMMRSSDEEDEENKSMKQASQLFQPKKKAMKQGKNPANKHKDNQEHHVLFFYPKSSLLWDLQDVDRLRSTFLLAWFHGGFCCFKARCGILATHKLRRKKTQKHLGVLFLISEEKLQRYLVMFVEVGLGYLHVFIPPPKKITCNLGKLVGMQRSGSPCLNVSCCACHNAAAWWWLFLWTRWRSLVWTMNHP